MKERKKWKNIETEIGNAIYKNLKNELVRECRKTHDNWWEIHVHK